MWWGVSFSLVVENRFDKMGHPFSRNPGVLPVKLPVPGCRVIAKMSWRF